MKNARLLVIDDDKSYLQYIEDLLRDCSIETITAASPSEGWQVIEQQGLPDVILLDILMPQEDGFAFLSRFKAQYPTEEVRVIMVSSVEDVNDVMKALQLGAADYIAKPFKGKELVARIEAQIRIGEYIKRLKEEEKFFRSLAEHFPHIVYIIECTIDEKQKSVANLETRYINSGEILGYSVEELFNPDFISNVHHEDVNRVKEYWQALLEGEDGIIEYRVLSKSGSWEWIQSRASLLDCFENKVNILATVKIITTQKKLEILERDRHQVLEMIARDEPLEIILKRIGELIEKQREHCVGRIYLFNEGHYNTSTNDLRLVRWVDIQGSVYGMESCFTKQSDNLCQKFLDENNSFMVPEVSQRLDESIFEICRVCKYLKNQERSIWCLPIKSSEGELLGLLSVCFKASENGFANDLNLIELAIHLAGLALERYSLRLRLLYQTQHDGLTGLPNLYTFIDTLQQCVSEAEKNGTYLGVLLLDIDRFSRVNEMFGHGIGDGVLLLSAARLQEFVDDIESVARISADNFAIILKEIYDLPVILSIAQSVIERFREPFIIGKNEIMLSVSVGVSVYPDDGKDGATLLKYADYALQWAKKGGRDDFKRYSPKMGESVIKKMEMENHLRRAVERKEFSLVFQPLVTVSSNEIFALEALLRWNSPELGFVLPSEFIPVAEDTGLIVPIGMWVFGEACKYSQLLIEQGYHDIVIAINISALQFQRDDFISNVVYQIKRHNIPAGNIHIEVTESVVMDDIQRAAARLKKLRSLGIQIWIDDFGTGYSSLQYLHWLPVNGLKNDRMFIWNAVKSSNGNKSDEEKAEEEKAEEGKEIKDDFAFFNAIVQLGHSLNLRVLAEGVETEEQLQLLRRMNCDYAQGFLFSKPLPMNEIIKVLKQHVKPSKPALE